ncbi:MAG TPA: DUF6351 family protein [Acidimicrobiia bacterium]|jgi:hypothetical protein
MRRGRVTVFAVVCTTVAGVLGVPTLQSASAQSTTMKVKVLSTRPQYVTGGNVLVGVRHAPKGKHISFEVDGHDATIAPLAGNWLVAGFGQGKHTIKATAGGHTASVKIVDHPTSGPLFSGPHLPLLCPGAKTASATATCAAPTQVNYVYRSTTSNTFQPLADPANPPPDVASTTIAGKTVPLIVRVERGVINRSPYSFASLTGAWNRRLVYLFGGGCGTSYSTGSTLGTNVLDPELLASGYAVATANFNTFQTSCNDVLSAETALMVKEHVIETLGAPRFTIGAGASGGAIQQLMIAQNYPGILDALSPVIPFPDALSIAPGVTDCGLLDHYFASPQGAALTNAQRAAITGYLTDASCNLWVSSFLNTIDPRGSSCDGKIPRSQIYSTSNRTGIRCTLQDFNRNLVGIDKSSGFANRPLDNVGVQYGLVALQHHQITVDQFLDLNERVGGFDIDGHFQAQRETAPAADFRRLYQTGRVLSGGGSLRKIPIITVNFYSDPIGDIHTRVRLFTIRDRLTKHGKVASNETIWSRPSNGSIVQALTGTVVDPASLVKVLDQWLTTKHQPAAAQDNCTDAKGAIIAGPGIYESGPCHDLYKVYGDPRIAAGAPVINDRLRCKRVKIDPSSYGTTLSSAQLTRLEKVFPQGVCDWKAKGVGQVPLAATWINYGKGRFAA